jgi:hypothetical protein
MKITVGYFRELLHQYDNAEISISRFVELLNQKVVSDQQDEWKPVEKETEFDGFYLGYIIKQEVCGAIYKHQRVLQNKNNEWVLHDNEMLTHWRNLPEEPVK